ncbi:pyridoxal phosphate-dependent aminotransferase [bacterium]|nr:pyridoxal phosphate-dependent aminotransferase [bacterium]MBU1065591.1 pyridoxal phosphate-dependent aminotransferase [bacterium]MBU1632891.1 pyridoxal phosphate-dependent aminotransferase [bacterium]MBU1873251.1 pyridoxal phosphate-dependent aminotransferase [bacterium]
MPEYVSQRAKSIKSSPTLTMHAKAREMAAKGIDVINFGVGEPDFDTPDYIKNAGIQAIQDNFTRYTAAAGIPELRKAIVAKLKNENHLDYSLDEILVSPGAKASIATVLMAICNPGDEVLIPAPYWVSYPSQVEMVDAIPVYMSTDESTDFKISAEQLSNTLAALKKPKVLLLNSPNNPTGAVYNRTELEAIAAVCVKHDLLVISDEIYEKMIYDGEEHYSIAQVSDEIKQRTIVINGVSKAFAMTGWRLGYAAGPVDIIKAATCLQGHTTSCVTSITQKASVAALTEDDGSIEKMRLEFDRRRTFLVDEINQIPHVSCALPKGAFYTMANVGYYVKNNCKGIADTNDLCVYLLEKAHIAVVTGTAFGMENYVRFSYANSMENLREGLRRFKKGLESLL